MRLFLATIFILLCVQALGTAPLVEFRKTFDGLGHGIDTGSAVCGDGRGGCFAAATCYQSSAGTYDAEIVHLGPRGNQEWHWGNRTANETEIASDIQRLPNGNVVLFSIFSGGGQQGMRLTGFTPNGQQLFLNSVPNSANMSNSGGQARLAIASDGAIYALGFRSSLLHLVKFDSTGTLLWHQMVNPGNNGADPNSLILDSNENPVVAVATFFLNGYLTMKFSPSGTLMWSHNNLGHHGTTEGKAIALPLTGGDILVAGSPETSFGVGQTVLYRLNAAGQQVWEKQYATSPNVDAQAESMLLLPNQKVMVASSRIAGFFGTVLDQYTLAGQFVVEKQLAGWSTHDQGLGPISNSGVWHFTHSESSSTIYRFDANGVDRGAVTYSGDTYAQLVSQNADENFVVGTQNGDVVVMKLNPRTN